LLPERTRRERDGEAVEFVPVRHLRAAEAGLWPARALDGCAGAAAGGATMNCLSIEQLVRVGLDSPAAKRPDDFTAARDHGRGCPACAAALTGVEAHLGLVAAAHDWFKRDHAAARESLLAALAGVRVEQRVRPWQDGHQRPRRRFTMRRVWIGSAAAAL